MPWVGPGPAAVLALVALGVALCCWPSRRADPTASGWGGQDGWGAEDGRGRLRGRLAHGWRSAVVVITGPVRRRAGRRRRGEAVVTVLDALAAGLEAGLPPALALREAAGAAEDPVVHAVFAAAAGDAGPDGVAARLVDGLDGLDGVPRSRGRDGLSRSDVSLPGDMSLSAEALPGDVSPPGDVALIVGGRGGRGDTAVTPGVPRAAMPGAARAAVPGAPHDRSGLEGVALLARAWWLSERLGSPLAEAVRTVATLVRADLATRRALASAMAEARATVLVLVALPVLGPVLAVAVGVSPGELYGSGAAVASTAVGAALSGAGYAWMRRLLRRVAEAGERP